MLLKKKRPPTAQNNTKVCSKMLCNRATQLRGWVRILQKTTNTLPPQHHNCSRGQLKVQNSITMSRGEEGIKKIVNVTSGRVEQCSARPATPLVAHKRDAKKCRNAQSTAASKEVDMGDVTREERVELCSARTAIPLPDATQAKSTSDIQLPVKHFCGGNNEDQYVTQGDVVSAAKDTTSRGEREGAINGEEKVEVCSAPTALPSLEIPKETEEPHVERTHDDNVSQHVEGDMICYIMVSIVH